MSRREWGSGSVMHLNDGRLSPWGACIDIGVTPSGKRRRITRWFPSQVEAEAALVAMKAGEVPSNRKKRRVLSAASEWAAVRKPRRKAGIGRRLRFSILERDGFACRYCGARAPRAELQVDHILPRAKGGTNHPDNLVTACRDCNAGKSAR